MQFLSIFNILLSILIATSTTAENIKCDDLTFDFSCIKDATFCIDKKTFVHPPLFDDPKNPLVLPEITWVTEGIDFSTFNSIEIVDQKCSNFPLKLRESFEFLEIIHLKSSGLKSLEPRDVWTFTNLKEIDVSENQITELKSSLFTNNQKLIVINFSGNPLRHVGYNFLIPLINLIDAKFFRSNCINTAERGTFDELMSTLRTSCKPTEEMWQDDIHTLTDRVEELEVELDRRDGKEERKRRCHINKLNTQNRMNCLSTGNYRIFEQRPYNPHSVYAEDQKFVIG